jgi:hypothetical protein
MNELLKAYGAYFDIRRDVRKENIFLAAEAEFHSRCEKYILVQSAKLWAVETNEYVYFVTEEMASADELKLWRDKVIEMGMKKIKPNSEHMYSYITMIYIADSIDDDTKREIEKFSCHKMFLLSLHGWMYFRMAAVDLSKNIIITNKKGRDVKKIIERIMQKV